MTTKEVSRKAGVTLRQLQWWDEIGLVPGRIIKHSRQYDDWQLRMVGIVKQLLGHGVPLQTIRRAQTQLTGIAAELNGEKTYLAFAHRKIPKVFASARAENVVEFAARARGPVTVVEVEP